MAALRLSLLLGVVIIALSFCGTSARYVDPELPPVKPDSLSFSDITNYVGKALHLNGAANSGKSARADGDDDKDEKKGWSVTTWALVIAGGLIGLVILSCLIASLFCACVKEILCLPITLIRKCCCCCC